MNCYCNKENHMADIEDCSEV